jgi:hypothetical protein
LEPSGKRALIKTICLRLCEHSEQRIDSSLNRTFAQQLCTETVNRVDVSFFERLERMLQPSAYFIVRGCGTLRLEALAEPKLQFASRLLSERHGDDLFHPRAHGRRTGKDAQDPIDELSRFAGSRRRLDYERLLQVVDDRPPCASIWGHRIDLSA